MKKLNVALIGCGFMGRAHSNAYRKVGNFFDLSFDPVLKIVCARQRERLEAFGSRWGWESVDTDWQRVVAREDVDLVDICVPNHLHKDIALAAARAGKMIACEKPLGLDSAEAEEMTTAVEQSGKPNMVWFNYRRVPAVALAKGQAHHRKWAHRQDFPLPGQVSAGLDY